ncbi:hypothetical protein [Blastopirellula marina]|uniref:Uncharacterized protein n=1 Tax=Blastopirellula marina DSM 3645 TaxID=314230 RepID=A3ZS21_9BACT|nr:hypothetical protein [Blastopirellula marina]EAQ80944.1 hypothetical protein DSM3645_13026 [Blastopirellula marina DSM 3645]
MKSSISLCFLLLWSSVASADVVQPTPQAGATAAFANQLEAKLTDIRTSQLSPLQTIEYLQRIIAEQTANKAKLTTWRGKYQLFQKEYRRVVGLRPNGTRIAEVGFGETTAHVEFATNFLTDVCYYKYVQLQTPRLFHLPRRLDTRSTIIPAQQLVEIIAGPNQVLGLRTLPRDPQRIDKAAIPADSPLPRRIVRHKPVEPMRPFAMGPLADPRALFISVAGSNVIDICRKRIEELSNEETEGIVAAQIDQTGDHHFLVMRHEPTDSPYRTIDIFSLATGCSLVTRRITQKRGDETLVDDWFFNTYQRQQGVLLPVSHVRHSRDFASGRPGPVIIRAQLVESRLGEDLPKLDLAYLGARDGDVYSDRIAKKLSFLDPQLQPVGPNDVKRSIDHYRIYHQILRGESRYYRPLNAQRP